MKLSILIAAYNVEKFIEKCVTSCYDEKLAHLYEILVVNDGSTDKTKIILDTLVQKIENLKIINKSNNGLGSTRNLGLDQAKGEYVWMIDGDDYIDTTLLNNLIKQLYFSLDIVMFNYYIVNSKYEVMSKGYKSSPFNLVINGSNFYLNNYEKSYIIQFVIRLKILNDNNIRFYDKINMQDSEILPKIMYYVNKIKFCNLLIYYYVQHKNSFTNSNNAQKRINYFESIITVKSSLNSFAKEIQINDPILYQGIQKKIISLHEVVFNHLVFFNYSNSTFKHVINLLKQHNFYPLKFNPVGKLKWVKIALNIHPLLAKKIISLIRK